MRGRKYLTARQRFANFGYGVIGLIFAALVGTQGGFEFAGVASIVIGAFAIGGIFRGIFGFDEV